MEETAGSARHLTLRACHTYIVNMQYPYTQQILWRERHARTAVKKKSSLREIEEGGITLRRKSHPLPSIHTHTSQVGKKEGRVKGGKAKSLPTVNYSWCCCVAAAAIGDWFISYASRSLLSHCQSYPTPGSSLFSLWLHSSAQIYTSCAAPRNAYRA